MVENTVDCVVACVNGCVLGDKCPKREYAAATSSFIENTSLDKILEMAEEAVKKKRMEPPKWVIPDFPE
ncbi:MAG: hypothetical protein QQW96_13385 [Tychonema bourrellyi B0820]|uniref:Uncharacterized protein n=1 Tax=Tychonema bourrellyi FEM_GT703 TaxID=2040638 RepID=A0A2G4EV83_9CYAN|nr:hypothetical protein [Tychonema bourrellyi]MDQ2098629.1 hypothetical protein [Tychonema bourrellyi B0820]PHX53441.1 hypothetical protein CP500_021505 [Tychonema bourrellyi FEM_GT703]